MGDSEQEPVSLKSQSLFRLQTSDLLVLVSEPPHPSYPPVVVRSLPSKVLRDLRVRQNEEPLGGQAFHGLLGHLFRLERGVEEERAAARRRPPQHLGAYALRTERR